MKSKKILVTSKTIDDSLGRENLYKALSSDVNLSFDTIIKVVKALKIYA